ncbi:MAG: rhodanese-like domain-containing protein, partial [Acidobacteria bacterium]|nr:rhodanese-like domain-containing protein [Acidobacteriota bacterium]
AEVDRLRREGHLVLDLRAAALYGAGHIAGALNIGLGGQFATWAGTLINAGTPLILVAEDEAHVDEALMRLARVGIESVAGYLSGGMSAWEEAQLETAAIPQISVDELKERIERGEDLQVIDVRRPAEYSDGHVPRAASMPLSMELAKQVAQTAQLDQKRPTAIICAGGYRSSAATSLLEQHGFHHLLNVTGGTGAWVRAGHPVEATELRG